jgi:hypothetical protein
VTISKEEQARVDESVAKLLEHFDSIRIFVTRHNGQESETESYDSGGGNLYAQLGQIQEWLTFQDQYARSFAASKQAETDEEEDDEPERE